MESNQIQNLAFLGTTGSGKSATCNTLSGENPGHFIEGHTELSCTNFIDDHICWSKNLRLFDMPGFGDNRILEDNINEILQQIALRLADPFVNSTKQIDAFVLVVKLDPRAQTLKADLEHIRELFGTVAFESLILVVIYKVQSNAAPNFLEILKKMEPVAKILSEGKQEEPNENWYCVWDNKRPNQYQERELLQKIKKLKPYTYEKFVQSQMEIKVVLDEKKKAELQRDIQKIEKKHELSRNQRDREIQELKQRYEEEKAKISERKDNDAKELEKFLEGLSLMNSEKKKTMEDFYKKMAKEEKEFEKTKRQELRESANENNMQIKTIMNQSQEMMRRNLEQMRRTIEESNQRRMEIESESRQSIGVAESLGEIFMGSVGKVGGKILDSIGDNIIKKIDGNNCSIF